MRYMLLLSVLAVALACALAQPVVNTSPYQQGLTLYQQATELDRAKKPAEAVEVFRKFIADFPRHENADAALSRVITLQQSQQKYADEQAAFEQFMRDYPKSVNMVSVISSHVNSLRAQGKQADAIPLYQRLGTDFPYYNQSEAFLWTAMDLYRSTGEYAKSLALADAYLTSPMTQGARRYAALQMKALAQLQLDNRDGIDKTLVELAQLPADKYYFAATCNSLANACRAKEPAAAAEYFLTVAEVPSFGASASSLYNAGQLFTTAGKFPEAVAAYRELLKQYPKSCYAVSALYAIAILYRDRVKDIEQELAAYRQLIANYPDAYDITAYMRNTISVLQRKNDFAGMQAMCDKVAEQFPGTVAAAECLLTKADYLHSIKDDVNAKPLYQKLTDEYASTRAGDQAAKILPRLP